LEVLEPVSEALELAWAVLVLDRAPEDLLEAAVDSSEVSSVEEVAEEALVAKRVDRLVETLEVRLVEMPEATLEAAVVSSEVSPVEEVAVSSEASPVV